MTNEYGSSSGTGILNQTSAAAEEAIAFHRAVKQGTSATQCALCGAADLFWGVAEPDATKDSYAQYDVVRIVTEGEVIIALAKVAAETVAEDNPAGTHLKRASNGLFEKETAGTRTATSVARLVEDGSFPAADVAGTVNYFRAKLL